MVTLAYEMEIAYRQQQIARDVRQVRGTQTRMPRAPRRRLRLPAVLVAGHRSV